MNYESSGPFGVRLISYRCIRFQGISKHRYEIFVPFGHIIIPMGTIVGRTRKDGSKAFAAQIVIKKTGAIVHRESQSFDRRQAANPWIVKREEELKKPGGFARKGQKQTLRFIRSPHRRERSRGGPAKGWDKNTQLYISTG